MNFENDMSVFAKTITEQRYAHPLKDGTLENWDNISYRVAKHVMKSVNASKSLSERVHIAIRDRKFIPGGRYLYASGRPYHQTQNCLMLSVEDSREGWSDLLHKSSMALMTGAGIGVDYSKIRPEGKPIRKTGGKATGPTALMQMINEVGRGVMQGGSRRCLPKGSLVHTLYGLKKIEDITTEDLVQTFDGFEKVLNIFDQGQQKTIKIKTQTGFFECTENHRVAVLTNCFGEFEWKKAKDLSNQDRLIFNGKLLEFGPTKLPNFSYEKSIHCTSIIDIKIPELDSGIAWLLGLIHGDGYAYLGKDKQNKLHGRVSIACSFDYPEIKDKAIKQLERFGVNVISSPGDGKLWNVKCSSVQLATYLQSWFKKPNVSIDVPECIMCARPEIRCAYIAGIVDSDGSLSSRPINIASSIYPEFLNQLQSLLASLGIVSRIKLVRKEIGKWKSLYQLNVCNTKQLLKLKKLIGSFILKGDIYENSGTKEQFSYSFDGSLINASFEKRPRNLHHDKNVAVSIEMIERVIKKDLNFTPIKILGIEEGRIVETYDIEVENKNQFFCNGYLVHNSAIWSGLNWSHADIYKFVKLKDWTEDVKSLKKKDFNFPAPLDMTNISVLLDDVFFKAFYDEKHPQHSHSQAIYWLVVRNMLETGEPGFSVDIGDNSGETLRNACVSGETEILTKNGYRPISSLVNQSIDVWNGFEWSNVEIKLTGRMQPMVDVVLSDGRVLRCTEYHKFIISKDYHGASEKVEAYNLQPGMKLIKGTFPIIKEGEDVDAKEAYTQGFLSAEGMDDYNFFSVYDTKYCCLSRLSIKENKNFHSSNSKTTVRPDFEKYLKSFVPLEWNLNGKLNWLAGLIDGDGTELKEGGCQIGSVDKNFLLDAQKMLSTIGINSKVTLGHKAGFRMLPDAEGGLKEYYCKDLYRLLIGAQQIQNLKELGLKCERLSFDKSPNRDASQFVFVVSVSEGGIEENVYCFNEPKNHTGVFDGVLTGQCTEVTSRDDSDICNLGSINLARVSSLEEMKDLVELGTCFLLAGTVYSDVPYAKVDQVRSKNRRLGLGLMGIHEWLLMRGKKYGPDPELEQYLKIYSTSTEIAHEYAEKWELTSPIKTRAIAPNGTIGIVSETTTGIEPIFCVSYKRRYKKGPELIEYQYVLDPTAKRLIEKNNLDPDSIEDAYDLAKNVERRIEFQAWVQRFVDHGISSTINLPPWGSADNNEDTVRKFGDILINYLPKLRGITCYPDGARGGQPLTPVKYSLAMKHVGETYLEYGDACAMNKGGSCGS